MEHRHQNPHPADGHVPLDGNRVNPQMVALKAEWLDAPDLTTQKLVAEKIQRLALDAPPFIPLGQSFVPYAFRSNLSGFVRAPIAALWGVRKPDAPGDATIRKTCPGC
jgi:ABC-type transport system substrate-binding protein